MSSVFDELAKAAAEGRTADPVTLKKLAKVYGAESRAADVVAPAVMTDRFRFAPGIGWLEWDGRRWLIDPTCEETARQAVREHMDTLEKDLRAEAKRLRDEMGEFVAQVAAQAPADKRTGKDGEQLDPAEVFTTVATDEQKARQEKLADQADAAREQADIWLNLLSESKIGNITKLSRRVPGVLTKAADLDRHHDLLNCHNGVVDLRTGELGPHDPELLITKIAGGDYDPSARSPQWDKALTAVHPECLNWLQIRMGQSLTGYMPDDDSLVVSEGGGENGKTSVMIGATRAAGEYYTLVSHRVLIALPGQHPTELMDLRGVRFALLEETPEEGRLDTHQLKMTVGTPRIKARHMRQDSVEFESTHTLWINTNHTPQVDATDHGTWRRLKRMPWPYRFVKPGTASEANHRDGDKTLRPYLLIGKDVPAAALAWMVAGAVKWYAQRDNPIDDPTPVASAWREWRSQSDVGYQFAAERLIADDTAFVTAQVMRTAFETYLTDQGKRPWSAQLMNQRLPDSMFEALGMRPEVTPAKTAKVKQGETESRPAVVWGAANVQAEIAKTGRVVRMWRGVRFRTPAEMTSDGHLKAV